jgi:hypothetical protein
MYIGRNTSLEQIVVNTAESKVVAGANYHHGVCQFCRANGCAESIPFPNAFTSMIGLLVGSKKLCLATCLSVQYEYCQPAPISYLPLHLPALPK